ncbi:MAG TPA: hypothetical protein PKD92_12290 [Novosphingobium sp.]|nr:hypothetical protein [Novosphingobium sp.]HMP57336.1 hypothetical protein [Novosphingobium sp.]
MGEIWPEILILAAPFGYFTLAIPGVWGFYGASFWLVVVHALIASIFAGTGGVRAKIRLLSQPNVGIVNRIIGATILLLLPWSGALVLSTGFYFLGRWLA